MMRMMIFLSLFVTALFAFAQEIAIDRDQCQHCNMLIRDKLFGAIAVEKEGEVLKFDAIECLINYLKEKDESGFEKLLVADYSNSGILVSAQSAIYLKSNSIPSPMGAYLTGYQSRSDAEKIQKEMGGELYDWNGIKARFQDSRFGLLDHPDHHHDRPDAYAPVGIMGDHVHHKGSFMISLSYMRMNMDGNLNGTDKVFDMEIYDDYMVSPQNMTMDMYMLGVMYGLTDRLTIMLMQSFVQKSMDASTMAGMNFTTKSEGLGDTEVSILYSLIANERFSLHLNSSLTIPQGDITMLDNTPMVDNMKLPYQMQLGSGSLDFKFGATLRQASNKMSWGVQPIGTIRTHKNGEGYRQGHEFKLNSWLAYNVNSWVSFSGRFEGIAFSEIEGVDNELNTMMSPMANSNNSGFTKLRSYVGSNISFSGVPAIKNLKLGLEYGFPLLQRVNGIQMAEENKFNAGMRYIL